MSSDVTDWHDTKNIQGPNGEPVFNSRTGIDILDYFGWFLLAYMSS